MRCRLLPCRWHRLIMCLFIVLGGCVGCSGGKGMTTDASSREDSILLSRLEKGNSKNKGRRGKRKKKEQPPTSVGAALELVLSTDKSIYKQGETVQMSLTVRNLSDETVQLQFTHAWPEYVVSHDGQEIWHWSYHPGGAGFPGYGVFTPKSEKTYFPIPWHQRGDRLVHDEQLQLDYYVFEGGDPVPPDTYQVKAVLPADPPGPLTSNVVEIQITP